MEYYQLLSEKYNLPPELYLYIWSFINNDELLSLKINKDDPVWNGRIPNIRSYFIYKIKKEICQKNVHCMEYFLMLMDKSSFFCGGDYRISDEHLWYLYDNNTIFTHFDCKSTKCWSSDPSNNIKDHNIISDISWLSTEIVKYTDSVTQLASILYCRLTHDIMELKNIERIGKIRKFYKENIKQLKMTIQPEYANVYMSNDYKTDINDIDHHCLFEFKSEFCKKIDLIDADVLIYFYDSDFIFKSIFVDIYGHINYYAFQTKLEYKYADKKCTIPPIGHIFGLDEKEHIELTLGHAIEDDWITKDKIRTNREFVLNHNFTIPPPDHTRPPPSLIIDNKYDMIQFKYHMILESINSSLRHLQYKSNHDDREVVYVIHFNSDMRQEITKIL